MLPDSTDTIASFVSPHRRVQVLIFGGSSGKIAHPNGEQGALIPLFSVKWEVQGLN